MKFTYKEYIQAAIDEGIFSDDTFPNLLIEHIGREEFLKILSEYCAKEDLVFNKDDKNLPPIFAQDWYQECLTQNEDEVIVAHHDFDKKEVEFYSKLKDIPQDKLTYIFFGDESV